MEKYCRLCMLAELNIPPSLNALKLADEALAALPPAQAVPADLKHWIHSHIKSAVILLTNVMNQEKRV